MQHALLLLLPKKYLYGKQIYGDCFPTPEDPVTDPVASFMACAFMIWSCIANTHEIGYRVVIY